MMDPSSVTELKTSLHESYSVNPEPVFVWKFFETKPSRVFFDPRSKLKGTFTGERFLNTEKPVSMEPHSHPVTAGPAFWNSYLLLSVIVLTVVIKRLSTRRYDQLLFSLSGNTALNTMLREWNPSKSGLSLLIFVMYLAVFAQFTLLGSQIFSSYSGNSLSDLWFFLLVFGGLAVLILFKFFMVRFLSFLFKTPDESLRYLTNHFGFFTVSALFMLPANLILLYNPSEIVVFFGGGIMFILLIIRIIRSFVTGFIQPPFSKLYLFLYLCALEIVPLSLIFKTFLMLTNGQSWG